MSRLAVSATGPKSPLSIREVHGRYIAVIIALAAVAVVTAFMSYGFGNAKGARNGHAAGKSEGWKLGESAQKLLSEASPRTMTVRAYCPLECCCGRWANGITASGKPVTYNGGKFVASSDSLAFGVLISVPGYHDAPVPVIDRGAMTSDNEIEVYFASHEAAVEWGVQELEVELYRMHDGFK